LAAAPIAAHRYLAPDEFQRKSAGDAGEHAAHQTTHQKWPPSRAEAVLEPVPGEVKLEMARVIAQQPGADAIGREIHRHHSEGIHKVGTRNCDRDVQAPPYRQQHHQAQVHRQRNEAHRDANAERRGNGVPIQRPKVRIGEVITK
jgi:hypothetical protein